MSLKLVTSDKIEIQDTMNGMDSAEPAEMEKNSTNNGTKLAEANIYAGHDRNVKYELIRRVGNRPLIYDSKHKHHHDRGLIRKAWKEISNDLKAGSELKDPKWCQQTWKTMKDYYFKKKRTTAKKSGAGRDDGEQKGKTWEYYASIHAILSKCLTENDATLSNMDTTADDVQSIGDPSAEFKEKNDETAAEIESPILTKATPRVGERGRKRRREDEAGGDTTQQILQMLKDAGNEEDEAFHFGMSVSKRLRSLSPKSSRKAQMKIQTLLYEIEFPSDDKNSNVNDSDYEMFI